MRHVFGFICVLALGVVPMVGCSGSEGGGGSGGTGGTAGSGGSGGTGGASGSGGAGGMVDEACVPSEWECISSEIAPIEEMCGIFIPDQANACDGTESLANPPSCTASGTTVTHKLTQMQIAPDCNAGFNLDGCDGRSCDIGGLGPAEGTNGVDNALNIYGAVLEQGFGCVDALGRLDQAFHNAICTDAINVEIKVDAVPEDGCAVVTVSAAGVSGDPIPMNLSDDGCLSGTLGTLPISLGDDVQGAIENAVVRMTVSSMGFSDGILGGTVGSPTAELMFDAMCKGSGTIATQSFDINADLSGDSMVACDSFSLTLEIGGDAVCPQIDCDDGNVCTKNVCNPADAACEYPPEEDGTLCGAGWCIAGRCEPIGAVVPCNELGLRAAIHNGGGPYTFDCDGPTTVVTDSEIVIDNDVMLDGVGNLIVEGEGDPPYLFSVIAGVTAELRGFVIQGGSGERGSGILNEGILTIADCTVSETDGVENAGVLTMSNSVVSDNWFGVSNTGTMTMTDVVVSRNRYRAGIVNEGTLMLTNTTVSDHPGGGIANFGGTLALTSSTVSGNSARWGGGIYDELGTLTLTNTLVSGNTADQGGGIYDALGILTLTNTLVSGNSARQGGGIYKRFGPETLTDSTITDSTVTENTATSSGGGIHVIGLGATLVLTNSTVSRNVADARGGGILTTARTSLQNCTVSGNSAPRGGGMTAFFADVHLANSTISGNVAEEGSAILHSLSPGSVSLFATIVEGECASSPAGAGGTTSNGYNLESPGDTCGFDQATDQVDVPDPILGPLQDNGGFTETHALPPSSVAIDAIPEAMCQVSTDQRGELRPETGGSMCDVGSFEVQEGGQ